MHVTRRPGMGSWLTDSIGGWINTGIGIIDRRYGVPPPGTVITSPGGQVIRQGPGYPVTPGGSYYPPSTTTPGGSVTYPSGGGFLPYALVGLSAALLVMVAGRKK